MPLVTSHPEVGPFSMAQRRDRQEAVNAESELTVTDVDFPETEGSSFPGGLTL